MANLVLKQCCACAKRQNVGKEITKCFVCGSILEVVIEPPAKPPKIKKGHRRRQEKVCVREMRR